MYIKIVNRKNIKRHVKLSTPCWSYSWKPGWWSIFRRRNRDSQISHSFTINLSLPCTRSGLRGKSFRRKFVKSINKRSGITVISFVIRTSRCDYFAKIKIRLKELLWKNIPTCRGKKKVNFIRMIFWCFKYAISLLQVEILKNLEQLRSFVFFFNTSHYIINIHFVATFFHKLFAQYPITFIERYIRFMNFIIE